jgi:hypothetical protein
MFIYKMFLLELMEEKKASETEEPSTETTSTISTSNETSNLGKVDVTKLYNMMKNAQYSQKIGSELIKAIITDNLRAKLGFPEYGEGTINSGTWAKSWGRTPNWTREWHRSTDLTPQVRQVIQTLIAKVSLSNEELRVVDELDIL